MHLTNGDGEPHRLIPRVALAGAVLMVMLTSVAAYLRLSAAGLGCEPWPACYAQGMQSSDAGERPRHPVARVTHRVLASGVGAAVVLIACLSFIARPRQGRTRWLSLLVLALTVALASLGRATPGSTSPAVALGNLPAVALGNLLGGMAMTALLWWMAWQPRAHTILDPGTQRWLARGAVVLVLLQVSLGALISTTHAAPACPALSLCTQPAIEGPIALHTAHRIAAATLVVVAGALAMLLFRQGGRARRLALALGALLVLQASAGALMVGLAFPLWLGVAHNIGASLVLLASVSAARA
jgi:cytochrome c oxidase assembly protein subunit 15